MFLSGMLLSEMFFIWNVLYLECFLSEMFSIWNVSIWNVFYLECFYLKCFLSGMFLSGIFSFSIFIFPTVSSKNSFIVSTLVAWGIEAFEELFGVGGGMCILGRGELGGRFYILRRNNWIFIKLYFLETIFFESFLRNVLFRDKLISICLKRI